MPAWVAPAFVVGAALSLLASSRLVRSLECLGLHLHLPELLLGLVVALAADGPELTSALTAMLSGHKTEGAGVLVGSNVFNIAALLGLGPLVAGGVSLHRRVVVLEAVTALGVALPTSALIVRMSSPVAMPLVALAFFTAYVVLAVAGPGRLPLPERPRRWLGLALREEEAEVAPGLAVSRLLAPSRAGAQAVGALGVVVGASVLMEHAATVGGQAIGIPQLVTGAVVLAAVTSLPNAVAAVYLARAGRGAALLAEAMNSNSINVVCGLALPVLFGGLVLSRPDGATWLTAAAYLLMTALALALAYRGRGLGRSAGTVLLVAYLVYLVVLAVLA